MNTIAAADSVRRLEGQDGSVRVAGSGDGLQDSRELSAVCSIAQMIGHPLAREAYLMGAIRRARDAGETAVYIATLEAELLEVQLAG